VLASLVNTLKHMFIYQRCLETPRTNIINFACSILKLEQNHVNCIPMSKSYLRVHLDHQAYFFSFQPYTQNVILLSLHSSNKESYMSDAGVVRGHSRFVIDVTVVLDNLYSTLIRKNTFHTNTVSTSEWVNRDRDPILLVPLQRCFLYVIFRPVREISSF